MMAMLHEFVTEHREALIRRCRAKVRCGRFLRLRQRNSSTGSLVFSISCRRFTAPPVAAFRVGRNAARHGPDLKLKGFTVSQVVHDYGDVCQSITDLALQLNAPINVEVFRTLNRCLDDAIASAVTEHGRGNQSAVDTESARDHQRCARNLPGHGCIFIIDPPRAPVSQSATSVNQAVAQVGCRDRSR
jgi:hypothetical protein